MCYTVASNKKREELRKTFDAVTDELVHDPEGYAMSGFTHPQLPVLLSDSPKKITLAQWGLIPHWVKSREQAHELWNQTLNAKGETIFEKPSFRSSALTKKCCVLVNGFFEWQSNGKVKTPHFIYLKDQEPFALGGLWEDWVDTSTGEIRRTCTIITTPANEMMSKIHNEKLRMPLIIPHGEEQKWLSTADEAGTRKMIVPFDSSLMYAHPVSRLVNGRSGNPNVPEAQLPAEPELVQGSLF
jgi:putative SOS response-associated peptidase YedK